MVSLEFATDLDRNCRIHRQQAVDEFLEKCRHRQSRHSAEQTAELCDYGQDEQMFTKTRSRNGRG